MKGEYSMHRILFICHGNICHSPMAEMIFKDLVAKRGLAAEYEIASAATSTEEIGNPVYPSARAELAKHGISAKGKYAVQLTRSDYAHYDLLLCMDEQNRRNAMRILGQDPEGKLRKLLPDGDVADPWYTDRFDIAYRDILAGCEALLEQLKA